MNEQLDELVYSLEDLSLSELNMVNLPIQLDNIRHDLDLRLYNLLCRASRE